MVCYFFIKKRSLDLNFVAFFGFTTYFFPFLMHDSLANNVYLVSSIILLNFIFYVFIYDYLTLGKESVDFALSDTRVIKSFFISGYVVTAIAFVFLALEVGVNGFFQGKTDRTYNLHLYGVFISLVSLGFLYSFYLKKKKLLVFYLVFLLLLFLSGTRTHIVLCFMALLILIEVEKPSSSLLKRVFKIKFIVALMIISFIGLYGKDFYASFIFAGGFNQGFVDVFLARVDNGGFIGALNRTEPYHTSSILQKVVEDEYRIETNYIMSLPIHFLPISSPFTDTLHFFSTSIKEHFYSGWSESSGIGGNYWAEGYALFGLAGVFLFSFVYLFILFLLDLGFRKSGFRFRPLLALVGVFWAFYIQRNSIFQIISHDKRVVYTFLFLAISGVIFSKIFNFKNK